MDYRAIGQRIRKLRREQELSQEQLAEKIWISTTHMSHIETGSTKLSLPVLVDIARALSVSADELLFDRRSDGSLLDEAKAVLDSCTPDEARLLVDILKSVKGSLDARKLTGSK